jgi:hypothetical protein
MTILVLGLVFAAAAQAESTTMLAASPSTALWQAPKAKGDPLALLELGLEVSLTGQKKSGMVHVKTSEPFQVEGWVKSNEIGCRVTVDTQIKEGADSEENLPGSPFLRKGALVRILKTKGAWLEVESAPYVMKIFSVSGEGEAKMTFENVATGYITRGWIPKNNCSAAEKPFFDAAPEEGTLSAFVDESVLYREKPQEDPPTKKDEKLQIAGKALKYCRWVELEQQAGWSRGYTDGPVVVKGWTRKDRLGPLPNTNPLNMIFLKSFKDCELMIDTEIKTLDGKSVIAKLRGGMEVFKVGVDYEGCIVKTDWPIVIKGLVTCKLLRSLGVLPEKAIEDTKKKPQNTFPERGPKDRPKKKN